MTNALSCLKQKTAESEALILDYNNFLQRLIESQKTSRSITISKTDLETQVDRANSLLHRIKQTQVGRFYPQTNYMIGLRFYLQVVAI